MIDSTKAKVKPNAPELSPKPVDWIGIDGCRGGWIIAWLKDGCSAEIRFAESLQSFLKQAPKDAVILIDMILYKPGETSPRPFDRIAKSQLGKCHSRVFPAPPKEALSAQNYPEACRKSFLLSGKKISKQCYNLFPKIREANHSSIHVEQLIEYHPEIAFKQLNANIVVKASKKTDLGRNLRQQLIADYLSADPLINFEADNEKTHWQSDDLLDALALALIARNGDYKNFYQLLIKSKTETS